MVPWRAEEDATCCADCRAVASPWPPVVTTADPKVASSNILAASRAMGGGHSSEKSPYVGVSLGARVLWEREGKGSSSWGGLNRMCMLFQKASLQACKPGQLEGGKSVCMPGSVPPLWLEFDCLFWND